MQQFSESFAIIFSLNKGGLCNENSIITCRSVNFSLCDNSELFNIILVYIYLFRACQYCLPIVFLKQTLVVGCGV